MIDFFVNHQLTNSDKGGREICGAYRRALGAKSSSEVIYDVIVWLRGSSPAAARQTDRRRPPRHTRVGIVSDLDRRPAMKK
jgi:hypothetical protein